MRRTKEQKALDEELIRECQGYYEDDDKPDGAYIEEDGMFFNINKIKRLIASGADMGAKDIDGETPLHVAVWEDNIAVAKLLIASGADVNAKGWNGFTPLDWAKSEEMEALLIEHGAK